MKNSKPLVSIVIPVYNGSNYMREAIESALHQTYDNIEVIVVNDGSTDNGMTEKIAKSYGNKIRYFKKENGGVSSALNLGIRNMKGDYFSWLSHDDRYYPNKVEVQMNYLFDNKLLNKNVITYTNYDVIDENSNVTNIMHFELYNPNKYPEFAVLHGYVSGTSLLIPKKAFDDFGLFDEKYRCIQDYLLFFNFMKKYKYIFIPLVTNSTRIHSKQVTNCNPNVVKENNYLWIYMQKELPDNVKIRLCGSKYKFYKSMYNYLNTIVPYPEAIKFSKDCADAELDAYMNLLIKSYTEEYDQCINSINNAYNDILRKKNYYLANSEIVNDSEKVNKIINELGLKEVLNLLVSSDLKISKFIINMNKSLIEDINGNTTIKLNTLQKVKAIKLEGGYNLLYHTIKRKLINKIYSNSVLRKIYKFYLLIRKIIFFIPKIILRYILNS